jgi:kinesin family protein 1
MSCPFLSLQTKEPKTFAFDFSYWSHDGFKEGPDGELIPLNDKYATQQKVFNDLGQDVLMSAYDGYNSTLFAYGQTGAGEYTRHCSHGHASIDCDGRIVSIAD